MILDKILEVKGFISSFWVVIVESRLVYFPDDFFNTQILVLQTGKDSFGRVTGLSEGEVESDLDVFDSEARLTLSFFEEEGGNLVDRERREDGRNGCHARERGKE